MIMIAGPCAVETATDTYKIAEELSKYDKQIILRGGCWKPRTKPDSFQGLGEVGVDILVAAYELYELRGCCLEVMDKKHLDYIINHYPEKNIILQIGSRNMQNFELLKLVSSYSKEYGNTVLLKRGFGNTINEMCGARDYLQHDNVILCERGIRTLSEASRFTLDLSAVPVLQQKTGCRVIVDPSHAAGEKSLVPGLARAGIAAGADGLEIEVKSASAKCPRKCDEAQALPMDEFYILAHLCEDIDKLLKK